MIPLALAVVVWCVVVVVRKTKNDDGPILRRYVLLVVAAVVVAFGSMIASSPVSGDASGQCGDTAVDAAQKPPDATADVAGKSCRDLGRDAVRQAEIALLLGPLLGVVVAVRTRRYIEPG